MKNSGSNGLSSTSTERVLEWLQKYIESRDLKTGDALPKELEIAQAVGVARSSVREALTALKALGIITSRKKGGIRISREPVLLGMREYLSVRYSSRACFDDAMEFRSVLENGIADLVFNRITRKEVAELRRIVEEVQNAPEGKADTYSAEKRFHTLLTSAARNRLAQLLSALYTPVFAAAKELNKGMGESPGEWAQDHIGFVDTLEKKDRKGFIEKVRNHTQPYIRSK